MTLTLDDFLGLVQKVRPENWVQITTRNYKGTLPARNGEIELEIKYTGGPYRTPPLEEFSAYLRQDKTISRYFSEEYVVKDSTSVLSQYDGKDIGVIDSLAKAYAYVVREYNGYQARLISELELDIKALLEGKDGN